MIPMVNGILKAITTAERMPPPECIGLMAEIFKKNQYRANGGFITG
jgi:hypothetical protein